MKILFIGGRLAGCSSAEKLSKIPGLKITLLEKSQFLGPGVRTFLTQKIETYNYLKKFLKLRNCNYHQFKSYLEKDNQFYNYPIIQKDIDKMSEKKIASLTYKSNL